MLKHSLPIITSLLLAGGLSAQIGSLLGTFPSPAGSTPIGIGVDPGTGNLWLVAADRAVYQMTQSGAVISSWSAASNTGIANGITSDGTSIYITDASGSAGGRGVDVYDMAGTYQRTMNMTVFYPAGVCWVAQTNNLVVVDRTGSQIVEIDLQGNQIATFSLASQHDGIGHDPVSNTYWAYDLTNDLVEHYDTSFTSTGNFAGPGAVLGAAGRGLTYFGNVVYAVVQTQNLIALFDTTGTSAAIQRYGTGCPSRGVFYEEFALASGDLTGLSFLWRSTGGKGWFVNSGGTWDTNLGPNLNLADDQILRNQALGFTFPIPGGTPATTTAIDISSNGYVGLMANEIPDSGFYNGNAARVPDLLKYQRIATWWDDLDPSAGGSVHFNTLSNPTRAVITWDQVPQFGASDQNSVQLQLFPNGDFVLTWPIGCVDDGFTGFSSGGDALDPGSMDYTMSFPMTFGPYGAPLDLDSGRPILGTTVTYTVSNIPAGAVIGGIIFGLQQTATPLDPIGMTGCSLLSSGDLATAPINLTTGVFSFPIPNQAGLIGANLYHQALLVAPGFNPFGAVASNGLRFSLGT